MVRQEIWAFLLTHYAVRTLMSRAADEVDIDPDELSFIRTLRGRPPPGHRPGGFFPLTTADKHLTTPSTKSSVNVHRDAATAPVHALSNAGATTPTASRNPDITASGTADHRPSNSVHLP